MTSKVPRSFDLRTPVNDGHAESPCVLRDNSVLDICIYVADARNLVRELRQFPFYPYTRLVKARDGDFWVLEFKARISEELIEYIIGRGENFHVVRPESLAMLLRERLASMLIKYENDKDER